MAKENPRKKGPPVQWKYKLVQAPTGDYYLVDPANPGTSIKVANPQQVKNVLDDIDQIMTDVVQAEPQRQIGAGSGVHIQIPDI